MAEEQEFPKVGETVVVKVSNVLDYGAFAELVDYNDIKGFIHISQVATGWIKNIRNFVKEGQLRAAKVQSVDRQKNQIDLSLAKVSPPAQRAKINEFKQLKRERMLIETLAERKKSSFDDAWDEVAEPLIKKHGSLVEALQKISLEGKQAAEGVPENWLPFVLEMVDKSVTVPSKTVKGVFSISVPGSEGVEVIKQALSKGASKPGETEIDILYLGSGKYLLKSTSHDFKIAEKAMESASASVIKFIESNGGKASFEREG